MEQHQFKAKFPLSTKLLLAVSLLLILTIGFLSLSAVVLVTEDKRAYLFQTQQTQATLIGREWVSTSRQALDTLRIVLGRVIPQANPKAQEQAQLEIQAVLDNQSNVTALEFGWWSQESTALNSLYDQRKWGRSSAQSIVHSGAPPFSELKDELLKNGFAMMGAFGPNQEPLLGVALLDAKTKDAEGRSPLIVGWMLLTGIAQELKRVDARIFTRSGRELLDSQRAAEGAQVRRSESVAENPLFKAAITSEVTSGTQEYAIGEERYLGSFVRPGLDLVVLVNAKWSEVRASAVALSDRLILLGILTLALGVIFAIMFAKSITKPLKRIYAATQEVSQGRFDFEVPVTGKDEISALSSAFNLMSSRIRELIQESIRAAHLESELKIASTVAENLIPSDFYSDPDLEIRSYYQSATECGGDWWGHIRVGSRIYVMIADATGHGLPSALITAAAQSCASVVRKLCEEHPQMVLSPNDLLRYANRSIHEASGGELLMTFMVGMIDLDRNTLTFANAGHNPAWILRKESKAVESLVLAGNRIGEVRDVEPFELKEVPFLKGDMLFLYTDGLTDRMGKKQVRALLGEKGGQGSEAFSKDIRREFKRSVGDQPLEDDVTWVILTRP